MRDTLDDRLKDFYQGQGLSPERLSRLCSMAEEYPSLDTQRQPPIQRSFRRQRLAYALVAAAILLAVGILVQWLRPSSSESLAQAVAGEIAMNHKKQLALEFQASDYGDLRRQMEKLDFPLTAPADPEAARLRLLGARYCSIQGRLAAQVRLRDDAGHIHTLYETEASQKLRAAVSSQLRADGIRVRTWTEKGVFYGLANSEADSK